MGLQFDSSRRGAAGGASRWLWTTMLASTSAKAAGLTDHIWTIKELLMTVGLPTAINTK